MEVIWAQIPESGSEHISRYAAG